MSYSLSIYRLKNSI